jgi:sialidase-1
MMTMSFFLAGAGMFAMAQSPAGPTPQFTDVYLQHDMGFSAIRIPSVVVTKKGTVLAFAEGRKALGTDQASNKILLRRSLDNGSTWSPIQVIDDRGGDALNNPCAVVESATGRIFLMYQQLPEGITTDSPKLMFGNAGPGIQRSWITTSADDGVTWSPPQDITSSVKRSLANSICSGPGIAIQLTQGLHAGRIVFPFNEGPFWVWNNYVIYSDDQGATWTWGNNVPGVMLPDKNGAMRSQVNEAQVVELSDGRLLLNSRQYFGAALRKVSISPDGGENWSPVADCKDLRDPSCMASIFRFSFGKGDKNVILFSGPNADNRSNGTIHVSYDDGLTWPIARSLWPKGFAYSVLTKLANGQVGCLFEADDNQRIVFARFDFDWIAGAPAATTGN